VFFDVFRLYSWGVLGLGFLIGFGNVQLLFKFGFDVRGFGCFCVV